MFVKVCFENHFGLINAIFLLHGSTKSVCFFWDNRYLSRDVLEGEGEVAFFSAKRWDRRNRADLIESATPCHDAQVVGPYRDSHPLRLTILAAMSEDYTTAPQHLNQVYKLYVRPQLDFGDIIYHRFDPNMSLNLRRKLEQTQYSMALAVTGAWRGTNRQRIYEELEWENLYGRRWYTSLCHFAA